MTEPGASLPSPPTQTDWTAVVPLFNGRPFIDETLASIRAAGCPDAQIVVVDDCSTDGGADYVEVAYPRVKLLRHTYNQHGVTRHTGLRVVETEFVFFIDQDDLLILDGVRGLASALRSRPDAVAAVGQFRRFVNNGGRTAAGSREYWSDRDRHWPGRVRTWRTAALDVHIRPHQLGCWMIRTKVAKEILLDPKLGALIGRLWHHDWGFLAYLTVRGPIMQVPDVTLHYRTREGPQPSRDAERPDARRDFDDELRSFQAARLGKVARWLWKYQALLTRADREWAGASYWTAADGYLRSLVVAVARVRSTQAARASLVGLTSSLKKAFLGARRDSR
jgi:glycosyltransferase involved in cell wall biosynthesis